MADLIEFLRNNLTLIYDNIWVFAFACGISFVASWTIHDYVIAKALHNIPERKELQKQVGNLEAEIVKLKEQLHQKEIKEQISEFKNVEDEKKSIGALIKKNGAPKKK